MSGPTASSETGRQPDGRRPGQAPLPEWWWRRSTAERRRIASAALVVALVLVGVGAWLLLGSDGVETPSEAEEYVASLPPERVATWDALAECESGSDWSLNSGNGFYGGLQFTLTSWQEVGGLGYPHQYPREEQIMRAEMLHDVQGWDAWPRCSETLGLTT